MYVYAVYMYHKYKYTYIYNAIFVDIELNNETLFEKKIGIKIQQNHISVIRFKSILMYNRCILHSNRAYKLL